MRTYKAGKQGGRVVIDIGKEHFGKLYIRTVSDDGKMILYHEVNEDEEQRT